MGGSEAKNKFVSPKSTSISDPLLIHFICCVQCSRGLICADWCSACDDAACKSTPCSPPKGRWASSGVERRP